MLCVLDDRDGAASEVRVMSGPVEFGWVIFADIVGPEPASAPLLTRLTARLLADSYDRKLVSGAPVTPGTALAVHARRLITVVERESVARSFRTALREARKPLTPWTARSWTHRPNVTAAADTIDAVTLHLHSPRPVSAEGVARLRLLLSDGTGPLYTSGHGDLTSALRTALSAL
jgi:hypothetical protein